MSLRVWRDARVGCVGIGIELIASLRGSTADDISTKQIK
jgi:hypothetical protein